MPSFDDFMEKAQEETENAEVEMFQQMKEDVSKDEVIDLTADIIVIVTRKYFDSAVKHGFTVEQAFEFAKMAFQISMERGTGA